jgi:hypothetical protein
MSDEPRLYVEGFYNDVALVRDLNDPYHWPARAVRLMPDRYRIDVNLAAPGEGHRWESRDIKQTAQRARVAALALAVRSAIDP